MGQTNYEPYTFSTLAGLRGGSGITDGTGADARFYSPQGVAMDSSGDVYVADYVAHTIRKITPDGVVSTLAGLGGVSGTNNGTGAGARFSNPWTVTVDAAGVVYVADSENHAIRKIAPGGVVTTLAGLPGVSGTNNGTGTAARFNSPRGVAVDGGGNVFVGDYNNHTIRKITPAGVVSTFVGLPLTSGTNNGTGTAARFNGPRGVAFDTAGNLYVADSQNNTVRKITSAGVVSTLAGLAGSHGSQDGSGNLSRFWLPSGIAVDATGNVYVGDVFNNMIRRITPGGTVITLAGLADNSGDSDGDDGGCGVNQARFYLPYGVAVDSAGNVFVGDTFNHTIRKITSCYVSTFAGLSSYGYVNGWGNGAAFHSPTGVACDTNGSVFVADTLNNSIRRISPAGLVDYYNYVASPTAIAPDRLGNLYVSSAVNNSVFMLTPLGNITTVTGLVGIVNAPRGLALDNAGNLYVADSGNQAIRKMTPSGTVTTVVGFADGLSSPQGVAVDASGNIYVADGGSDAIYKATPGGNVTILAGSAAGFNYPSSVAVDSFGNVYVADFGNDTIRKITTNGIVTTLAGSPGASGNADGIGNTVRFNFPTGIAVDSAGHLFVADQGNDLVRMGATKPPNDNFAQRLVLDGSLELSVNGSSYFPEMHLLAVEGFNVGASKEPGESLHAGNAGGKSVWWTWTTPSNWPGSVAVQLDTIGSTFDTLLAVYSGSSVSNLALVAADDDSGANFTSQLQFVAAPSTTYQFAVDGYAGASGIVKLTFRIVPPANDYFTNAANLVFSQTIHASTIGATRELFEPDHGVGAPRAGPGPASIWWRYTAPTNGVVEIQISGTDSYNLPVLAAYQGDAFTNISLLESSYTAFGEPGNLQYALRSRIRFEVVSGLTYYIAADSWSEVGFDLQATFTSAPGNDAFDSRYLLKPAGVSASGSNVGATLQPGESASGSRSVWWSWTPDSSAPVFLTTFGSTFDTALSIFTGTSFGSLSLVAFNDNASALASPDGSPLDTSSRIKFFPNAGTPYQISVSGQSDESGRVALNFTKVGIEDFTINQRNLQADNSANFNVTLHLTNLRTNATGPLRIRLLARAAYDCITYLKSDLDFLDSLNVPDEEIGTVDLPLPATIGAGASTDVSVSGVCPPPSVYYGGIYYGWGYARSIIAILEELAGSAWQSQDARPFLVGAWPDVQNFQGTGGGVITVSSGLGSSASNPGILDVRLGPPAAIRMGGAWRVSPTNYGELAELRFYTNYIASSRKLAVQSTNFSLELREMPGFVKPANQAVQIVPGNVSVLDLSYSVTPPRLNFSRAAGLSIVGTTGTAYRVEITPQLQASNSWSPVTNVTLGSGTNSVPGTAPSPGTNRFYRTVWLTD